MLIKIFARAGRKCFFLVLIILLLLVLFPVTSHGKEKQEFINSCGDIHSISFPFQLQGDPSITCNDEYYTLLCDENNRTVLNLPSGKYYVQSINYTGYSIHLVDVGLIQTNDTCSPFPLSSSTFLYFANEYEPYMADASSSVAFLSCENPVQSPIYINMTSYNCNSTTGDDPGELYYSYAVAGNVSVWDVADSCLLEAFYLSSSQLIGEGGSNFSWLDLNKELGYGFEVYWESIRFCKTCRKRASCFQDSVNFTALCSHCWLYYEGIFFWLEIYAVPLVIFIIGVFFAARLLCVPCVFGF